MKKEAIGFADANKLVCEYDKNKKAVGVYGCYNLLNVSMRGGDKGTEVTLHNQYKKVDSLAADLKRFGFVDGAAVNGKGNAVIYTLDKKYNLKASDYKWILDTALAFVKKFDLPIGNCESCGRAGAEFFKDVKSGEYYCVCENCLKNVRSGFNKERGEKTGFWAALGRLFRRRHKTHKNLQKLERPDKK